MSFWKNGWGTQHFPKKKPEKKSRMSRVLAHLQAQRRDKTLHSDNLAQFLMSYGSPHSTTDQADFRHSWKKGQFDMAHFEFSF